jgi:hypothetical protein
MDAAMKLSIWRGLTSSASARATARLTRTALQRLTEPRPEEAVARERSLSLRKLSDGARLDHLRAVCRMAKLRGGLVSGKSRAHDIA